MKRIKNKRIKIEIFKYLVNLYFFIYYIVYYYEYLNNNVDAEKWCHSDILQ